MDQAGEGVRTWSGSAAVAGAEKMAGRWPEGRAWVISSLRKGDRKEGLGGFEEARAGGGGEGGGG